MKGKKITSKYDDPGRNMLREAAECYIDDPWEASRLIGEVNEMLRIECNRRLVMGGRRQCKG